MLRVALVGGPMYDGLLPVFAGHGVEIVVHADHPTLNRTVAELLAGGERIDVLSTHSKYAPSQAAWLTPLDDVVDVAALAPRATELCRVDGAQRCVPRNIDVRVGWVRADRIDAAPATWPDLAASDVAFGFTGRESGCFGTFFEIVTALGGALFDASGAPTLDTAVTHEAVELMVRLAARVPDVADWHYDDVDRALGDGRLDLAAAWPGATATLRASAAGPHLRPLPYLAGPVGVRSYSGCHAWAIPTTSGDPEAAAALVQELCSAEVHALDAAAGTVCAHVDAFAAVEPLDDVDAERLRIVRATVADGMITYPPHPRFPEVEDAGWSAIRGALLGEMSAADACAAMQASAAAILRRPF